MSTQWIVTDALSEEWRQRNLILPTGASTLDLTEAGAEEQLLALRAAKERGTGNVIIADVGRLGNNQSWAYVSDVVSKSGVNPLRGLGAVMNEPFIDVSNLYHLPEGKSGLTVTSLGSRYETENQVAPACGELHNLAILAHTEGLRVTAVIVEAGRLGDLDPGDIISS